VAVFTIFRSKGSSKVFDDSQSLILAKRSITADIKITTEDGDHLVYRYAAPRMLNPADPTRMASFRSPSSDHP